MVIVNEDGQLYTVVDRDLNTPGNWRAILQLKLKNLKTGSITNSRVRPQDKVEQAYLDKREMLYMKEGNKAQVVFYEGKPISIELPATVDLKVIETEPSVKGATAAAQFKP